MFIFLWFIGVSPASAQTDPKPAQTHEITFYAMPTLFPISWESPADLYNTMFSCYLKTILVPDNYLLGHLAVQISTPLLQKPLLTGMASVNQKEKMDHLYIKKTGFAILGASLKGGLETDAELKETLKSYAKRHKLAFITYRINEQATKRILRFMERFSHSQNNNPASCNYYGGFFWPRFQNEGAGCTAFGMALLDLVNLLDADTDNWLQQVNIPMSIIGGEFNNNKKIKISTIRKTKSWYNGPGEINIDYIAYNVYDPSKMYHWILEQRNETITRYKSIEVTGVPGLYVDCSDVHVSDDEPLFTKRSDFNVFINKHFEKNQALSSKFKE